MKAKLIAIDQIFMHLSWFGNGFRLTMISWLFDTPNSSSLDILSQGVKFTMSPLGSIVLWPSKNQKLEALPEIFKTVYPSARCIIDCTEIFYQKPSSLFCQSSFYSSYKHHVTYKGLLGTVLCGEISFISEFCKGSVSGKDIYRERGILRKIFRRTVIQLW